MISIALIFGAPVIASARKGGFDAVERMDSFLQLPFDCRNELENRAVVLDMVHFRDLDAAGFADPAQIITHQIDNHQQFRPILFALQQLLAVGAILLLCGAPWSGSFNRTSLHLAVAICRNRSGELLNS